MSDKAETAASFDAWARAATHTITLHSGTIVDIRIPDLPALIEAGEIPQDLLDVALDVANAQQTGTAKKLDREQIVRQKQFVDTVVQVTVVKPKVTSENVSKVPVEDKELLVEIATRQRDMDAVGDHIAGLETSEKFRRFRGIGEFEPAL